jgi:hypothetical protein
MACLAADPALPPPIHTPLPEQAQEEEQDGENSWSRRQLAVMQQQRAAEWDEHVRSGWLPPFIIAWFEYLGTLDWNAAPCYDTLERIIESAMAGQQHVGAKRRPSSEAAGALRGKPRPRWAASASSAGLGEVSCTVGETETMLQFDDA